MSLRSRAITLVIKGGRHGYLSDAPQLDGSGN
jgi:hypothetical protein